MQNVLPFRWAFHGTKLQSAPCNLRAYNRNIRLRRLRRHGLKGVKDEVELIAAIQSQESSFSCLGFTRLVIGSKALHRSPVRHAKARTLRRECCGAVRPALARGPQSTDDADIAIQGDRYPEAVWRRSGLIWRRGSPSGWEADSASKAGAPVTNWPQWIAAYRSDSIGAPTWVPALTRKDVGCRRC